MHADIKVKKKEVNYLIKSSKAKIALIVVASESSARPSTEKQRYRIRSGDSSPAMKSKGKSKQQSTPNTSLQQHVCDTSVNIPLLDEKFYLELLQIEYSLIQDNKNIELIERATDKYRQCIEQYDSHQDPIKLYFQQKLGFLMSKPDTLETILNTEESNYRPRLDSITLQQQNVELAELDESVRRSRRKSSMFMSVSDEEQLDEKLALNMHNQNHQHLLDHLKENPNNLIAIQKRMANYQLEIQKVILTLSKQLNPKKMLLKLESQGSAQDQAVQEELKK